MQTTDFSPADDAFAERVAASFERQAVMRLIGAELGVVQPGLVEIELPYRAELGQQHGYLHAGIITTVLDSACGYAAYSLMPAGSTVLSVEFKVNLLSPAGGERFVARGRVIKPGRLLTVCSGELLALNPDGSYKLCSLMQATMIQVAQRGSGEG